MIRLNLWPREMFFFSFCKKKELHLAIRKQRIQRFPGALGKKWNQERLKLNSPVRMKPLKMSLLLLIARTSIKKSSCLWGSALFCEIDTRSCFGTNNKLIHPPENMWINLEFSVYVAMDERRIAKTRLIQVFWINCFTFPGTKKMKCDHRFF